MPTFNWAPQLRGSLTAFDVLNSEGTLRLPVLRKPKPIRDEIVFELNADDYYFALGFNPKGVFVRRNNVVSILTLEEIWGKSRFVWLTWTPFELKLDCFYSNEADPKTCTVPTQPTIPPMTLLKWARAQNLIETKTYASEDEFRAKLHSCILSIQDKVTSAGSYTQFWNTHKEGRTPKRETEVHPFIHSLLYDQALMSGFEIIPEYKNGIGNLDFLFIASSPSGHHHKICAEFKNAHSPDWSNGILAQLPAYMKNCEAKYGIYVLLNYKGEWFNEPKVDEVTLQLNLDEIRFAAKDPLQGNIRSIILNCGKPKSASKL